VSSSGPFFRLRGIRLFFESGLFHLLLTLPFFDHYRGLLPRAEFVPLPSALRLVSSEQALPFRGRRTNFFLSQDPFPSVALFVIPPPKAGIFFF